MLNMDFSQRVVIDTTDMEWTPSPAGGVDRKPLAREEAERGHATSIVRYRPGAAFQRHEHPLGEEILVLEGVFSDESGDYGAGTYLRNPPGSGHAPFSKDGCTLLVKLHQFHPEDRTTVRVDTQSADWIQGPDGLQRLPLHAFHNEQVSLIKWPAGTAALEGSQNDGEEVLVLSGELCDEQGRYPAGTWIRSPHLSALHRFVEQDTIIWVKTGHLAIPGPSAMEGP